MFCDLSIPWTNGALIVFLLALFHHFFFSLHSLFDSCSVPHLETVAQLVSNMETGQLKSLSSDQHNSQEVLCIHTQGERERERQIHKHTYLYRGFLVYGSFCVAGTWTCRAALRGGLTIIGISSHSLELGQLLWSN